MVFGSSIIYSLHTNDIRGECDSNVLIKYSDDAAVVAFLDGTHSFLDGSHSFLAYENTVSMISVWCKDIFLELNACKTKELCIDFRTSGQFGGPLCIGGEAVEVTDTFKYLGITLDSKLTFGHHVQSVYNKCQQRLYLLRKLRSFHVDRKLILLLYRGIIESVLTYCSICFFFTAVSVSNKNILLRICKTVSKIIGLPTQPVSQLTERAMVRKAHAVANDPPTQ